MAPSTPNSCTTKSPAYAHRRGAAANEDAGEHGVEEGIKLAQELLIDAKDFVAAPISCHRSGDMMLRRVGQGT